MVDKLYIMLPEFQIKKEYNIKAAWNDFYRARPDIVEAIKKSKDFNFDRALKEALGENPDINVDDIDMDALFKKFVSGHKEYEWVSGVKEEFSKWFKERKQQYFVKHTIEKLKYDYSKPAHKQKSYRGDGGLARRNNALIDMMWGILTNPDTAPKMLNPGGFDKQKIAARVVTILDYMTEEELKKGGYTIQDILRMSYDTENLEILDKLASRAKRVLDPLSPRTQVILHQQNMTGGKMIGIYANHNANHAIIQHTDLAIDDKNGSFKYGGIIRTSLHSIKNERGEFISRNNANYLAASVDNVKDNTLHATNQNEFTGDMTMLLSRLGYTPTEIAILMRQPIVMEITRKYFRERREGKSAETVIKEVISITSDYAGMVGDLSYGNIKNNTFELETLMKDIMLYKDIANLSKKDKIDFYGRQVTVGLLFQRIMKTSEALSQVVNATRADTQGGAAGPTIADTMIKLQKVDDLYENMNSSKFPLIGASDIIKEIQYNGDIDQLREDLLNSRLPFMQTFYTLGLRETERILGKYFPHFTKPFKDIIKELTKMTKTGRLNAKTINNIYNDLLVYIMSRTEFFGSGLNIDGKMISTTEKRRALINNFPAYFKQIVNDNEDIAELEFIQRLKTAFHNDKNPVDVLIFKNVGQLTPTLRERYMRDWTTLLYMKNPKAQELALNLFLYSYFRNGFAFGPSTFIHLAPVAIRTVIHDYISTLKGLIDEQSDFHLFINQYIYNHLDNRQFVPEVPEQSTIKFTDEKGNIRDEVAITINKTSPNGDKSVVLSEETQEDTTVYTFFKFITKKVNGKNIYYRLTDTQGWDTAIYTRIEPLGYKNSFLEYEWGKQAHEIESVIDRNKRDYDPKSEFLAQEESNQSKDDLRELIPHYPDNYFIEIANQVPQVAFEEVYGDKPADTPKSDSNSITNIEPNDSYRDANDDEICSGNDIAVL